MLSQNFFCLRTLSHDTFPRCCHDGKCSTVACAVICVRGACCAIAPGLFRGLCRSGSLARWFDVACRWGPYAGLHVATMGAARPLSAVQPDACKRSYMDMDGWAERRDGWMDGWRDGSLIQNAPRSSHCSEPSSGIRGSGRFMSCLATGPRGCSSRSNDSFAKQIQR